jgi:hypothetical protein
MIVADSDLVPSGLSPRAGRTIGRNLITVPISMSPAVSVLAPARLLPRFEKGTVNGPLTASP